MKENKFKIKLFTYKDLCIIDYINCIYRGSAKKTRIIKKNVYGIDIKKYYK